MKQLKAAVTASTAVMPGTCLTWLEAPDIAAAARPGQFVMVRCGGDTLLPRPLSVHRVEGSKIALLFQAVGRGTRRLAQLAAGDSLDIFGPLGNGFTINPDTRKMLLVAGGIGIAPLAFLADEAVKQGKEVFVFMGARNLACLLPEKLLPAGIADVVHTTEDGSAGGFRGLITAAWADMHLQFPAWQGIQNVYACGPVPMYRAMAELGHLKGKDVQVSLEIMMGCGAGVCYGCTIKTKSGLKQVCRDGPVFALEDIYGTAPGR